MDFTKQCKVFLEAFPFCLVLWEKREKKIYCLYVNPAAEKLLGIKREEWIEKEVHECYPTAKEENIKRLLKVFDDGRVWRNDHFTFEGKKQFLIKFTAFRIDSNTAGILTERLGQCQKVIKSGEPCPHTAVMGDYCMKHAMAALR